MQRGCVPPLERANLLAKPHKTRGFCRFELLIGSCAGAAPIQRQHHPNGMRNSGSEGVSPPRSWVCALLAKKRSFTAKHLRPATRESTYPRPLGMWVDEMG